VISLWSDTLAPGMIGPPRSPLPGDTSCDVAIVGGGYTGLWAARTLSRLDRSLRVVVVERDVCGFGASGRNGGWCSSFLPMSLDAVARHSSRDGATRLQREMFATVDEVIASAAEDGIEADIAKGGTIKLARTVGQVQRLRAEVDDARTWGLGEHDLAWLDADDALDRVRATDVLGAITSPHCAALHPARLVRGLADAVERAGVVVHERTAARELRPGRVVTDHGTLRAEAVLRCTEGYTATVRGHRRTLAPLYSLMIATEPIDDAVWAAIGWSRRETLSDGRQLIIYAQRTGDGRIAFGGRGAPYHFGSAISLCCRASRSRTSGEVHSACHGIGTRRSASTGRRAWGGPAGTWATELRCPTSPVARSRTSWSGPSTTSRRCRSSVTAHAHGSPSRCGGWASTPGCGCRR
jgi:glycine/D-amino acid oxidase-like deaminating enzyme